MVRIRFNGRSLTLLSMMIVGAMIGTSLLGAASVQGATAPVVPLGDGTSVSVSYTIYKDGSGYTCAKNAITAAIDFRDTNSRTVIQKAIDKLSGGYVYIKAGTYDISKTIYTNKVSIVGDGNGTILKIGTTVHSAGLLVTNGYYKLDGTYMSSRPTGITISNLQVDGNRAVRTSGTMEGIGMINTLNSKIFRVYVHDVIAGQGIYMSNSQYCSIKNSQVYNIGDTTYAHYGSGIAFGEASSSKIASAYITIDKVRITKVSMSCIDLEPANHVTITNCVFREASTWNGHATPVITEYVISGWGANDYITATGNNMYGAFGEFIVLTPSNHCVISNNVITYTAGKTAAIYSTGSYDNVIKGNKITTIQKDAIVGVNCRSFLVEGNTIDEAATGQNAYGIRFFESGGTSSDNQIKSNTVIGFKYAITANYGSDYSTITYNTVKSSYVGLMLTGTHNVKIGNVLNGALERISA